MVTFRIPDMTCGHCASTIAKAVAGVDKAARIEVDVPGKTVAIHGTAAEHDLAEAIQDAGYTPTRVDAAPAAAPRASGCGCAGRRAAAATDAAARAAASGGSCCS